MLTDFNANDTEEFNKHVELEATQLILLFQAIVAVVDNNHTSNKEDKRLVVHMDSISNMRELNDYLRIFGYSRFFGIVAKYDGFPQSLRDANIAMYQRGDIDILLVQSDEELLESITNASLEAGHKEVYMIGI